MAKQKERKLTPAEQRRKEDFDAYRDAMDAEGYKSTDLTFGLLQANILSVLIMLPVAAALAVWYFWYNGENPFRHMPFATVCLLLAALICLAIVHELIHAVTWAVFAPSGLKAIEFGLVWSLLTPYCTCREPLKRWQYILGSLMPTIVLGLWLGCVAVLNGHSFLLELAILMCFGGGADFCVTGLLLAHKKVKGTVYRDHPYECGVVAFSPHTAEMVPEQSSVMQALFGQQTQDNN